jgi:MoxR-like ATPase
MQHAAQTVHVADQILDYLQALIQFTRNQYATGLSPRAGLGLRKSAQAWAMLEGRDFVTPEDVQAVFASIATHRIQQDQQSNIGQHILQQVSIS